MRNHTYRTYRDRSIILDDRCYGSGVENCINCIIVFGIFLIFLTIKEIFTYILFINVFLLCVLKREVNPGHQISDQIATYKKTAPHIFA